MADRELREAAEAVIAFVPLHTGEPMTGWQRNSKERRQAAIARLRALIEGSDPKCNCDMVNVRDRSKHRVGCPVREGSDPASPEAALDGLIPEDRSEIAVVPAARREMWDPDSPRNRRYRSR